MSEQSPQPPSIMPGVISVGSTARSSFNAQQPVNRNIPANLSHPPTSDRVTELLAYNNTQVEKRREACALLREAGDFIDGVTGARDRPGSDSHEIVTRIETFLAGVHE